jgi:hypothetical protein
VISLLLVIYLLGAIFTARCLNISTMSREGRPLFSLSSVIWPLSLTVFGLFVLLALLAHWYDRLAAVITVREADIQGDRPTAGAPSRLPRSDL